MICNFLTNDMTDFRNTAPFAHYPQFFINCHKCTVRILNLSVLEFRITFQLQQIKWVQHGYTRYKNSESTSE
jgi:hypothetical protein